MLQKQALNQSLFEACDAKNAPSIDIERVKSLLAQGADPNFMAHCDLFPNIFIDKKFVLPLLHIISGKHNSVEVAEILIEHGAQLHQVDTAIGNTPLLTAITLHDRNLAKFLITKIQASHDPNVKAMLDQKGANEGWRNTPLILALKKEMSGIALLLIDAGANPNITCQNSETALHWACILRKNEVITALLGAGANKAMTNQFGRTPYEYYVYILRLVDVANPIQKGERQVRAANFPEFNELYLHVAEHKQNKICSGIQQLVEGRNKTSIDLLLVEKIKAIGTVDITLEEQHEKILKEQYLGLSEQKEKLPETTYTLCDEERDFANFLIAIFIEIHKEKEQREFKTELSFAIKERDKTKIEKLLSSLNKDTVNEVSPDGFAALHWAAMLRDDELISKLIACGADSAIKNKYGRTPMDYYQYQIRKADFKAVMSADAYNALFHISGFETGPVHMQEFHAIFWNDSSKMVGAPERNKKSTNLLIFGPNFPLNPVAGEKKVSAPTTHRELVQTVTAKYTYAPPVLSQPSSTQSSISTGKLDQTREPVNQPATTIPPDLQNALYDGGVKENYIKTGITTLENLIALHAKAPWAISALRCSNIREGVTKKQISIDELGLLNEEQTHSIEHKYQGNDLTLKVKELIAQNKVAVASSAFANNG